MAFNIEPITSEIGANVWISPHALLDDDVPAQILDALNRYNVLVFPQLGISDDVFAALTGALGEQHDLKMTADNSAASEMGIYRIALDKDDKTQLDYIKGNDYWHIDGTVYDAPGKATLLKCESPPSEGGDTEFANLFAAYAALPDARKMEIETLRVIHCLAAVGIKFNKNPSEEDFVRWHHVFPPREHPLVWHQQDGRTSLLIGATASDIVGMDHKKGTALLDELLEWCTAPRFTYRHHWQKGDMVMFNNPGLLHRSHPYTEAAGRVMHRTTLKGHEAVSTAPYLQV